MRLVCPNCSAQYEIDGSMIPDEGRDVQCSNCGHTWFELPGPQSGETSFADESSLGPEAEVEDDYGFEDPEPEDVPTSRAETRIENLSRDVFEADEDGDAEPAKSDDTADAAVGEPVGEDAEQDTDDAPALDDASAAVTAAAVAAATDDGPSQVTQRRPADAADLDVLREEAERELSQRRAPPSEPIETQTDLGLDTIRQRNTPSRALRARMAHLGEDVPEDRVEDTPAVSEPKASDDAEEAYEEPKRDLLPDINEINSTLKPAKGTAAALDEARQRSGFRVGFLLILFATLGLIFAYAQAPAIARALPNTEPALITYVDRANAVRDWVSQLVGN